ncbi:MAG: hypothetical protein AAF354_14835 [Pseudomonadota bacterium]
MSAKNIVHTNSAPTSLTTAYTSSGKTQIWEGTASNNSGAGRTLTVAINDGTTSVVIVQSLAIADGSTVAIPFANKVLEDGWLLELNASGANVQVNINGKVTV